MVCVRVPPLPSPVRLPVIAGGIEFGCHQIDGGLALAGLAFLVRRASLAVFLFRHQSSITDIR